jgi:uncharacterized protein YpmB
VRHIDFKRNSAKNADCVKPVRGRKLTAILYLNDEWDGGQLRVHVPKSSCVPVSLKSSKMIAEHQEAKDVKEVKKVKEVKESEAILEPNHIIDNEEQAEYFDIDPVSGRLVIFRR